MSVEISVPQQADGFIINATMKLQISPCVDRKRFLLSHYQTIYDCSWFLPSSRASKNLYLQLLFNIGISNSTNWNISYFYF